MNNKKGS